MKIVFLTCDGYSLGPRWDTIMHGASTEPLRFLNEGTVPVEIDVLGDNLAAHTIEPGGQIFLDVPVDDLVLGRAVSGQGRILIGMFEEVEDD